MSDVFVVFAGILVGAFAFAVGALTGTYAYRKGYEAGIAANLTGELLVRAKLDPAGDDDEIGGMPMS